MGCCDMMCAVTPPPSVVYRGLPTSDSSGALERGLFRRYLDMFVKFFWFQNDFVHDVI